jgi:hypothetical protein
MKGLGGQHSYRTYGAYAPEDAEHFAMRLRALRSRGASVSNL